MILGPGADLGRALVRGKAIGRITVLLVDGEHVTQEDKP